MPALACGRIVDIALKALSTGCHDTTTAVIVRRYLTAVMVRSASRQIDLAHRFHDGKLRVIACGSSFHVCSFDAFEQVRRSAEGNLTVLLCVLRALHTIASRTGDPRRKRAISEEVDLTAAGARRAFRSVRDAETLTRLFAASRAASSNLGHRSHRCAPRRVEEPVEASAA